jgi:hypothetical protein
MMGEVRSGLGRSGDEGPSIGSWPSNSYVSYRHLQDGITVSCSLPLSDGA